MGLQLQSVFFHPTAIRRGGMGMTHGENRIRIHGTHIRHKSLNAFSGGIDSPHAGIIDDLIQQRLILLPADFPTPEDVFLVASLSVHVRAFHIQTVQNPADTGFGCLTHPARALHHSFQIQIAVKRGKDRRLAVTDKVLRCPVGLIAKQMLHGAVGVDIDQTGGRVQTARIDDLRSLGDHHRGGLAHLRDSVALPCDDAVPDNAFLQNQFRIDNRFHGMYLLRYTEKNELPFLY